MMFRKLELQAIILIQNSCNINNLQTFHILLFFTTHPTLECTLFCFVKKFNPLSLVVRTILFRISYSECVSFTAQAKTSKVWEPLSCLHASATEHLSRLLGSAQCAGMPIWPLLLVPQQSVVVGMESTLFIAPSRFHCQHSLIHPSLHGGPWRERAVRFKVM